MQAEQLAKHLQLEQQKAEQDRAKWERSEAELQRSLQETMSTSQRLQDAKDSAEQEHSSLQELHRQVMAELEQRNGQVQRLHTSCTYLLHILVAYTTSCCGSESGVKKCFRCMSGLAMSQASHHEVFAWYAA